MLRRDTGSVNPYLELMLYQNRLQLATADALYSDGNNYRPVNATIRHLKSVMPEVKNVLALGTGLGSLVQIINSKGYQPQFTLVEYDKVVLQWALEFMHKDAAAKTEAVCMDANLFMARNSRKFDLVFIDIFNSRVVPDFVTTPLFLGRCRDSLNPGGHVAFNFMIDDPVKWLNAQEVFGSVFEKHTILDLGINRVMIGWI